MFGKPMIYLFLKDDFNSKFMFTKLKIFFAKPKILKANFNSKLMFNKLKICSPNQRS